MRNIGKIIKSIKIKIDAESEGKNVLTLFDTGSDHSYIRKDRLPEGEQCRQINGFTTKFGGKQHNIDSVCMINAEIDGLPFNLTAYPVDEIGQADGKELDMLIGAPTMEETGIILNPKKRSLDLSILEKGEFTEF